MKETCIYLLCFLFYSIVGWAFEVTLYLIRDKKFVNRGFLNGPYCPVYGSGGIMIWLLFGNMQNPLGIFLSSAVAACTLEYLTSYIMEKLFHARWWDYSEMKFNLNGRICLLGAVTFGTFAILLVYLIHPAVSGMLEQLPDLAIYITAGVLGVLFVVDCIVTVSALLNFHQHLEKIFGYLDHAAEQLHKKHRSSGASSSPFPGCSCITTMSCSQNCGRHCTDTGRKNKIRLRTGLLYGARFLM